MERLRMYTIENKLNNKAVLEPCFYCDGEDVELYTEKAIMGTERKNVWAVRCNTCGDGVRPDTNKETVIKRWNEKVRLLRKEKR